MTRFAIAFLVFLSACVSNRSNNDSAVANSTPSPAPTATPTPPNGSPFAVVEVEWDGTKYTRLQFEGEAQSRAAAMMAVFVEPANKDVMIRRGDAVDFDISATGTTRLSSCSQRYKQGKTHYNCDLIFNTSSIVAPETVTLDMTRKTLTLTAKSRNSGTETLFWLLKRSVRGVPNLKCEAMTPDGTAQNIPDSNSRYRCVWKF